MESTADKPVESTPTDPPVDVAAKDPPQKPASPGAAPEQKLDATPIAKESGTSAAKEGDPKGPVAEAVPKDSVVDRRCSNGSLRIKISVPSPRASPTSAVAATPKSPDVETVKGNAEEAVPKPPSTASPAPSSSPKAPSPVPKAPATVPKPPSPVPKAPSPVQRAPTTAPKAPPPVPKAPSPVQRAPSTGAKAPSPVQKATVPKPPSPPPKPPSPVQKATVPKPPSPPPKPPSPVQKATVPKPPSPPTKPPSPVQRSTVPKPPSPVQRATVTKAPSPPPKPPSTLPTAPCQRSAAATAKLKQLFQEKNHNPLSQNVTGQKRSRDEPNQVGAAKIAKVGENGAKQVIVVDDDVEVVEKPLKLVPTGDKAVDRVVREAVNAAVRAMPAQADEVVPAQAQGNMVAPSVQAQANRVVDRVQAQVSRVAPVQVAVMAPTGVETRTPMQIDNTRENDANSYLNSADTNETLDQLAQTAKGMDDASMEKTQIGRWMSMFERLLIYKDKHGDFLVPNRYAGDPQLGAWVATQRREYKLYKAGKTKNKLTPDRIQKLSDIGFDWEGTDPRHAPWDVRYQELCDFVKKNGHAQVPARWKENLSLSNWISKQRHDYKLRSKGASMRLSDERLRKLEAIGFLWDPSKPNSKKSENSNTYSPSFGLSSTGRPSIEDLKRRAQSRMGPANGMTIEPPDFELDQMFQPPGFGHPGGIGGSQPKNSGISDLKAIQTTLTASALVADPDDLIEAARRNHAKLQLAGLFPNGIVGGTNPRETPGGLLTLPIPVTNNIVFVPVFQGLGADVPRGSIATVEPPVGKMQPAPAVAIQSPPKPAVPPAQAVVQATAPATATRAPLKETVTAPPPPRPAVQTAPPRPAPVKPAGATPRGSHPVAAATVPKQAVATTSPPTVTIKKEKEDYGATEQPRDQRTGAELAPTAAKVVGASVPRRPSATAAIATLPDNKRQPNQSVVPKSERGREADGPGEHRPPIADGAHENSAIEIVDNDLPEETPSHVIDLESDGAQPKIEAAAGYNDPPLGGVDTGDQLMDGDILPQNIPLADDLRELRDLIRIVQQGVEPDSPELEPRRPQHDPPPHDSLIESIRCGRRRTNTFEAEEEGFRRPHRSDPPEG